MPEISDLVLQDASILIESDPPKHSTLRTHLNKCFNHFKPSNQYIGEIVDTYFNRELDQEIDFVEDIAANISLDVICNLLGWPIEDKYYLRDWTNRFSEAVGYELVETDSKLLQEQKHKVSVLHSELNDVMKDIYDANLNLEGMIQQSDKWPFLMSESMGVIKSFAFAGNHSTAIQIANAIYLLGSNKNQYAKFLDGKVDVDTVYDEILRYKNTFRGVMRRVKRPTNIEGVDFNIGDYVLVWLSSANKDENHFSDPNTFNCLLPRKTKHLSYGYGRHYCIGSKIAEIEIKAVLKKLRKDKIGINFKENPVMIDDPWVDGFSKLSVHLTKGV